MSEDLAGVPFLDAEECCKWPVSGDGLELRVCGAEVGKGRSYGAPHHMLAYVPMDSLLPVQRGEGGMRSMTDEGRPQRRESYDSSCGTMISHPCAPHPSQ